MRTVLVVLLLSGCGLSPEYMAKRQDEQIAKYDATCQKLGFKPDTDEIRDCKLRLYQESNRSPAVVSAPAQARPTSCVQSGAWVHCN